MDGRQLAQLADTVGKHHPLEYYVKGNEWAAQQKLDGQRVLLYRTTTQVGALNRNGQTRTMPFNMVPTMESLPAGDWTFDGELVGGIYYVFDILRIPNADLRDKSWARRQGVLSALFKEDMPNFELVPFYLSREDKAVLLRICRDEGGEGVVFKNTKSHYTAGRGAAWTKFKLIKDVDCEVYAVGLDGKDNLGLQLYRDGEPVPVGKVSALQGDGPDCQIGDVVTVTVLSVSQTGKLIQPKVPRLRSDKRPRECTWDQLDDVAVRDIIIETESK